MFINLIFFVTFFLRHTRIFCHKIFNIFNTMNIKSFYYVFQINQGKLKFRLIFFSLLCCKFSWNFSCKFFLLLLLPCLYWKTNQNGRIKKDKMNEKLYTHKREFNWQWTRVYEYFKSSFYPSSLHRAESLKYFSSLSQYGCSQINLVFYPRAILSKCTLISCTVVQWLL